MTTAMMSTFPVDLTEQTEQNWTLIKRTEIHVSLTMIELLKTLLVFMFLALPLVSIHLLTRNSSQCQSPLWCKTMPSISPACENPVCYYQNSTNILVVLVSHLCGSVPALFPGKAMRAARLQRVVGSLPNLCLDLYRQSCSYVRVCTKYLVVLATKHKRYKLTFTQSSYSRARQERYFL